MAKTSPAAQKQKSDRYPSGKRTRRSKNVRESVEAIPYHRRCRLSTSRRGTSRPFSRRRGRSSAFHAHRTPSVDHMTPSPMTRIPSIRKARRQQQTATDRQTDSALSIPSSPTPSHRSGGRGQTSSAMSSRRQVCSCRLVAENAALENKDRITILFSER